MFRPALLDPVPLIQGEKPLTLHSPPPALTNPVFFFKNPKKGKKKQEKQQKKRVSFLVSAGLMIDASSVGMFELYCKVQKQTYFLLWSGEKDKKKEKTQELTFSLRLLLPLLIMMTPMVCHTVSSLEDWPVTDGWPPPVDFLFPVRELCVFRSNLNW